MTPLFASCTLRMDGLEQVKKLLTMFLDERPVLSSEKNIEICLRVYRRNLLDNGDEMGREEGCLSSFTMPKSLTEPYG